ncbi:hypothetical protein ACE1TF_09465 [Geomicrobium sp. JSM 1781026]|uniref:hypothetical protein n=1 Tax=Geomicrobium sp. JSM 1781026 TaxID=3344580 RepID=UPI0035BEF54F
MKRFSFLFVLLILTSCSFSSQAVRVTERDVIDFEQLNFSKYLPTDAVTLKYEMHYEGSDDRTLKERKIEPTTSMHYTITQTVNQEMTSRGQYELTKDSLQGKRTLRSEKDAPHTLLQSEPWEDELFTFEVDKHFYEVNIKNQNYEKCVAQVQSNDTHVEVGRTYFCPGVGEVFSEVRLEESKPNYITELVDVVSFGAEKGD